jgi:1,4-alpha-glucan branching enzyme
MRLASGFTDLWELPAAECGLVDGAIYYYWFEVSVSQRGGDGYYRQWITDPAAMMVDWRVLAPRTAASDSIQYPASVIKFSNGTLVVPDVPTNEGGETGDVDLEALAPNNRLVIYELPTTWTRSSEVGGRLMGVGTFRDVTALIDADVEGANFDDLDITRVGSAYLRDLGVNAIELLPPADSLYNRQWGYGTTNYFAPDYELGFPLAFESPAPNGLLYELIRTCHSRGIRFFVDVVMAFSKDNPYLVANAEDFFILDPSREPDSPDARNSRPGHEERNGYGASLFRYAKEVAGYDPISGLQSSIFPARQWMKAALDRWMSLGVDGVRMDSVENVANWDFVEEYKDYAHRCFRGRYSKKAAIDTEDRFLVVGEELSEPHELLSQGRLDGLWHQAFKDYIRMAILGRNHENEADFETTVRKAIDCREFGYSDLSQAIIYLTSHDVEGFRNERLYSYLVNNGVAWNGEQRVKLAFACLLTAVGIPMILAGDEFADQHHIVDAKGEVTQEGGKQIDPVNFNALKDDWRQRVHAYVERLIKLRTSYDALSVNDVQFIHSDFDDGKRVMAWRRGVAGSDSLVVVVANFSDYGTPSPFSQGSEYVVRNWPKAPAHMRWREMTHDRPVAEGQEGYEPIFPWEAKVYALTPREP